MLVGFLILPLSSCFFNFVCRSSEASCNVSELKTPKSGIRELAMAMLQIEQMVESKYLNPPLGIQSGNCCV